MPALVDQRAPPPVAAEAPLVLLEEVLVAGLRRPERGLAPRDLDGVTPPLPAQTATRRDGRRVPRDGALDRRHQIRLVVDRARGPGHQRTRHVLADEDDAAPGSMPDVEAQVDFGEIAHTRPGDAPDARVEEAEC